MAEPSYRDLHTALMTGQSVQFLLPPYRDEKWIDWHRSMQEPSLGYALCKWRIKPTTPEKT